MKTWVEYIILNSLFVLAAIFAGITPAWQVTENLTLNIGVIFQAVAWGFAVLATVGVVCISVTPEAIFTEEVKKSARKKISTRFPKLDFLYDVCAALVISSFAPVLAVWFLVSMTLFNILVYQNVKED